MKEFMVGTFSTSKTSNHYQYYDTDGMDNTIRTELVSSKRQFATTINMLIAFIKFFL